MYCSLACPWQPCVPHILLSSLSPWSGLLCSGALGSVRSMRGPRHCGLVTSVVTRSRSDYKGLWCKPLDEKGSFLTIHRGGRAAWHFEYRLRENILVFHFVQLDNGTLPSAVNGPAFPSGPTLPGPPKITLAG
jgi:hypothetical protein